MEAGDIRRSDLRITAVVRRRCSAAVKGFWDRDLGRGYTPRLLAFLAYPLIFGVMYGCEAHYDAMVDPHELAMERHQLLKD